MFSASLLHRLSAVLTQRLFAGALVCAVLASAGCQTTPYCEPLSRCGGDFIKGGTEHEGGLVESEWVTLGDGTCTDKIQLPVVVVSTNQQRSRTTTTKGPPNATVDWCSSIRSTPTARWRTCRSSRSFRWRTCA